MSYSIEFTARALKELRKMDKPAALLITSWIRKNLLTCQDPRRFGKALKGDRNDQWRYRVGQYRILAQIDSGKILILILSIGHRKDVYR